MKRGLAVIADPAGDTAAPRRLRVMERGAWLDDGPGIADERDESAADAPLPGEGADVVARRWQGFLALADGHGVPAEAVAAQFTIEDIVDLCAAEHDDAALARCMGTCAESIRRERGHLDALVDAAWDGDAPGGGTASRVRCADCRHFRRHDTHPRLGDCAAGGTRTAAGGFWDDQARGCGVFEALPR